MADFSSVLEVSRALCRERYTLAGNAATRSVPIPATHVRFVPSGMLRVYGVATSGLRLLVRTLFLFPVMIATKIALYAMHAPGGDYITLGFVILVIALFAMLALVMLLLVVVGPRSQREDRMDLAFRPPTKREVERVVRGAVRDGSIRVVGRVDAGLEPGATVLDDHWADDNGRIVRLFEASSFMVVPSAGEPVVVDLAECPVVLARYEREHAAVAFPGVGAVTSLGRYVLRQGETVEVFAGEGKTEAHALLQSAAAATPYRESEGAMVRVLTSAPSKPLVIRSLGT